MSDQSQEEVITPEVQESQDQTAPEQPIEAVETPEEDVEIDYEGEKYRVPPKLKEAFMRTADYTQKTQEVAATRKELEERAAAFEQERQLAAQAYQRQQANLQAYSTMTALDQQLSQYEQVNWQAWSDQDPVEAQKAFIQYNQLKENRGQLANFIQQQEHLSAIHQQQEMVKLYEQGREVLAKEIPNWSDETKAQIRSTAAELGFNDSELSQVIDPRHVKTLYYARIGMEALKKSNAQPQSEVKPVKTIKSGSNSNAITDPDKLSTEEWMKWRNRQSKAR